MKTSSGDPLYQGFLTELHRSLCNRDSALNTESNMNSPFSRVRLNLEGPGIANEPRVESSSQARSNGQESAGFIEAGSVAVNSAMNPIDAIR